MKTSTKKSIQKVISIALFILGGYYLLIAINLLPSIIAFGSYVPSNKELAIISIIIIATGLFVNDKSRKKIIQAFQ